MKQKDTLNEFQLASKQFLCNKYSPDTYFEHCRMVLGDQFTQLFPELIVLLPSIEKQKVIIINRFSRFSTKYTRKLKKV